MNNSSRLIQEALKGDMPNIRKIFSSMMAEKTVDCLSARSSNPSSLEEMSARAHYRKFKKKGVVPGIDRKRYPNREKEGLEGPYRSKKSGKIYYYDKKEGKYYDPDSDMFLQVSDIMESSENKFKPHMMYDPKTGKGYKANTYKDHLRMDKMGYVHEKPKSVELDERKSLHPDLHKIKKTRYGYQLFIYSPSTGKFIAQGSPHKTKRAAEKDAMAFAENKQLDEALKSVDQKIALDVYSKLKKGDKVKVDFGNAMSMSSKPIELVVTSPHRIVGKSKVGRIILKNPKNMGGMKYTLYNRNGKVSLAQGDMGTLLKGIEIINESVLDSIIKSHNSKMPIDIDIDGNIIHVTPDISEKLINLHDELNESNQKDMVNLLESDTSSFVKLIRFAQER